MNHYFETTDKEIIDDKIIKLSLKQNPSFETVIMLLFKLSYEIN